MTNFESLLEEIGGMKCVVALFFFSEGRELECGLCRHPRSVRLQRIAAGAATNNSNYHRRAVQVQAWLSKSSPAYAVRTVMIIVSALVYKSSISQVQVLSTTAHEK
jgi:hypothetical protein